MSVVLAVFGPLAGPECRRALARGWVIVVRTLVAAAPAFVVLFLLWSWWLSRRMDPSYLPSSFELRIGLAIASHLMLTIALVMAPAVLAGSLAGERERGVLQHLLATAVSPREIVMGRLAGKLSQVGMVLLAAVPLVMILAAWNGLDVPRLATLWLLLASVLVGGGGLAVGASVIARRGRDALLGAYVVILVLLLAPLAERLVPWGGASGWLDSSNPFSSLSRLVWDGETGPALSTSACWLGLAVLGTVLASWRLQPSCLASTDHVNRTGRRRRVPSLGERPMLWKELFVERAGTLGRLGRWVGLLIIVPIGGGSLVLSAIVGWSLLGRWDAELSDWATDSMSGFLRGTYVFLGWLIQWAIGLRAAVAIASERERGTWDALLTSRLEPGEIVSAKVYGSLFALRWLLGAIVLAWTLGLVVGAIDRGEYANWMVGTLTAGILMAAVGVRCSLSLATATKAMTWTIALWLGSYVAVSCFALAIICLGMLGCLALWVSSIQAGLIPPNIPPWFPLGLSTAWSLTTNAVTFLIAVLLVIDTRLRFDRIAGRMAEGAVAVALDAWLHGQPGRPVRLDGHAAKPVKPPASALEAALSDDRAG